MSSLAARRPLHRVPFIQELVIEWLRWLYAPWKDDYKDIDAAGLVCKQWHECALAVKWEVANVQQLIRLLAPVVIRGGPDHWVFQRPPGPAAWTRFVSIAPRILRLRSIPWFRLTDTIVNSILLTRPQTHLAVLPNLRVLQAYGHTDADLVRLFSLCSTEVRSLTVRVVGGVTPEERGISFLNLLPTRFPHITHLELDVEGSRPEHAISDGLAGIIPQLQALKSFTLATAEATTSLVGSLAQSLTLETLDLEHCRSGTTRRLEPWSNFVGGFPVLVSLKVAADLEHSTTTFLTSFKGSLRHLALNNVDSPPSSPNIAIISGAIARHYDLVSLRLVGVTLSTTCACSLLPLRACQGLEELEIKLIGSQVSARDDQIHSLVSSWTRLRTLELLLEGANITLKTVVSALVHCPQLGSIRLAGRFVTCAVPSYTERPHKVIHTLELKSHPDDLDPPEDNEPHRSQRLAEFFARLSDTRIGIIHHRDSMLVWVEVQREYSRLKS